MSVEEAKKTLNKFRKSDGLTQHKFKNEIIEAFRVFWNSNPTEKEFAKYIGGLVIFPELSYIMVKEGKK
jgi:hypothetical protein